MEAGYTQEFSWSVEISNMQLSIATADVYPKITKTVTAVDGYTRLSLSNFKQPVTTIDLLSGIFTTDLLPPQF